MEALNIITKSTKQTQKIAQILAKEILVSKNPPRIIALVGELGSGKTVFVQGFAQGLGIKEKILSPTFVILKKFKIPQRPTKPLTYQLINFYHVDCYRIESPKELEALGFREIVKDRRNIAIIEWAEKISRLLPQNTLWIEFKHHFERNKRHISIKIKNQR